ncbi:MvaI/BcnI family restriction endonuclease [Burkholderia cepacia]|uniref:MvaI/BcnI family restriction endonuclease n=1 Tax=Burkholderia cepacia TaxID=292 RepID=UPI00158CA795|nr:MvaI/BcnI family restriction endonuclease [Burkholderia cepacia]MDN7899121.1 MvaI/BcnI family restriction endonuclease [Burkholderia cepacia]
MTNTHSDLEHTATSLSEITEILRRVNADTALLKILPKNANDKNQIYIASDFGILYDLFDMTLSERGESTSTKDNPPRAQRIPEATFGDFAWVSRGGELIPARRAKAIIYPQYPEARLSGFQTVENTMPPCLSVSFTKTIEDRKRLLVLGRTAKGACRAMVYLDISIDLENEIKALPSFERSKVCRRLSIDLGNTQKLEKLLSAIVGRRLPGCRLNTTGQTLPFTGTQVCGYTLEHALSIIPNASKNGDLFGIELKTHTQLKVTLFTPEPDLGLYARDFAGFMTKYGYLDGEGNYRVTGIHKANVRSVKSGLTLKLREYRLEDDHWVSGPYNPNTSLTSKMDAVEVILEDDDGFVAAGWSLERLMNSWGAKHNETVYISALKENNPDPIEHADGYEYVITFSPRVMWCHRTSVEMMLKAIHDGVIFLDPAPKLHTSDPSKSKRRAQWRVNDIRKAAPALYAHVELRDLSSNRL